MFTLATASTAWKSRYPTQGSSRAERDIPLDEIIKRIPYKVVERSRIAYTLAPQYALREPKNENLSRKGKIKLNVHSAYLLQRASRQYVRLHKILMGATEGVLSQEGIHLGVIATAIQLWAAFPNIIAVEFQRLATSCRMVLAVTSSYVIARKRS